MNFFDIIQILATFAVLIFATPILGSFMANIFTGEIPKFFKPLKLIETFAYRFSGINSSKQMNWKEYSIALIAFNLIGFLILFLIQIGQHLLPLNPQNLPGISWHLAFNTAVSFMTNTNWQAYAGETTMSYFTQMVGLGVQNFVSAGTGIAVLLALARGLSQKSSTEIGSFWVDLTRSVVYLFIPICTVFSIFLMSQGVVQNFSAYIQSTGLEGVVQIIPMGPAASQIAIKQLGTNGGGFFNVNSAHPFEDPTPLSNWFQLISILLIPMALTYTFGLIVKAKRQGVVIFVAMLVMLCAGLGLSLYSEYLQNDVFNVSQIMEGKETRIGVTNSVLWSVFTTAASNGSVNAMHSSLSPLSGAVAMVNMMLGEVIFGGVGAGLYGMLLFVLLTVFLAGLMVGRTPEYLGKKIEAREIQMVMLGVLAPCAVILIGAGVSSILPLALSSLANKGPHGLSEILYAFSSAAGNNGSAFAGLNANTVYYNVALGISMLIGRFAVILPVLAIAGSMGIKKVAPPSPGTFSTDNTIFVILLIAVVLIVGALTFFPALTLGPIVEHFLMKSGQGF